jgi:hypothetical protein
MHRGHKFDFVRRGFDKRTSNRRTVYDSFVFVVEFFLGITLYVTQVKEEEEQQKRHTSIFIFLCDNNSTSNGNNKCLQMINIVCIEDD